VSVGRPSKSTKETHGNLKMTKLISFGLMGLAAFRVMAFCFAYRDKLPPVREKSAFYLFDDADSNDSPMIEIWLVVPGSRGTVGKQREKMRAASSQTTSPGETGSGTICTDGFQSARGRAEGFHD
jgi:hypothetical protein